MTKKQRKQYIFALVALAVCIVGYFLVNVYIDVKKSELEEESLKKAEENTSVIFEMEDVSGIAEFSYKIDGETLKFTKNNDGIWVNENNVSKQMDGDKITIMLETLLKVTGEKIATKSDDVRPYGFDAPMNHIVITEADGTSHTLIVGSQNEFDTAKYYLMLEGDENVYVVDSTIPSAFSKALEDLEEEETTVEETTD